MSQFYSSVKRRAALCLRLSQLQGKLKFAIRRGIRKLVIDTVFAIVALEGKFEALDALRLQNVQTHQSVIQLTLKTLKQPTGFTLHSGQLIPTFVESKAGKPPSGAKIPTFTVHDGQLKKMNDFEAYLESLQLPPLKGYQSSEQLTLATRIRDIFVRESLFKKLTYDPTSPLLVFAPYILKLPKFRHVFYWIEHEHLDYAVRVEIQNQATNQYYDSYPKLQKVSTGTVYVNHQQICIPGIASTSQESPHFFCRKKTGDWELWHYPVSDTKSA